MIKKNYCRNSSIVEDFVQDIFMGKKIKMERKIKKTFPYKFGRQIVIS